MGQFEAQEMRQAAKYLRQRSIWFGAVGLQPVWRVRLPRRQTKSIGGELSCRLANLAFVIYPDVNRQGRLLTDPLPIK